MTSSDILHSIPLLYRLFFLYIEPISALLGALFVSLRPAEYLTYFTSSPAAAALAQKPPTATVVSLYQLSNMFLVYALNQRLVLSSTTSHKTWRAMLSALLIADFGHLSSMVPLAQEKGFWEVFGNAWGWNVMEWGSVGYVYCAAVLRICFLLGVGLGQEGHTEKD